MPSLCPSLTVATEESCESRLAPFRLVARVWSSNEPLLAQLPSRSPSAESASSVSELCALCDRGLGGGAHPRLLARSVSRVGRAAAVEKDMELGRPESWTLPVLPPCVDIVPFVRPSPSPAAAEVLLCEGGTGNREEDAIVLPAELTGVPGGCEGRLHPTPPLTLPPCVDVSPVKVIVALPAPAAALPPSRSARNKPSTARCCSSPVCADRRMCVICVRRRTVSIARSLSPVQEAGAAPVALRCVPCLKAPSEPPSP